MLKTVELEHFVEYKFRL